jgi:hypothetical protein
MSLGEKEKTVGSRTSGVGSRGSEPRIVVLRWSAVRIVRGSLLKAGRWEMGDRKWMWLGGVRVGGVVTRSEDASDRIKGIGCDRCAGC